MQKEDKNDNEGNQFANYQMPIEATIASTKKRETVNDHSYNEKTFVVEKLG